MEKAAVGMIGLAVMGANLARNLERNGYRTAVFNRTTSVTDEFIAKFPGNFAPAKTLQEFVASLERPRKIIVLVQAGAAVDALIATLTPLLEKGDIIIDGGNSFFKDTQRREKEVAAHGMYFVGLGVSGGEEGALNGPSLMPGGPKPAWEALAPMLAKIAAFADEPCTNYVGPDGAGHFVKMVHNGIEYGDMQLIAETYDLLHRVAGLDLEALSATFGEWNKGVLQSYLIEISEKVLNKKDDQGEGYLLDKVLDKAGQKGTGKWTSQVALDLGIAIPTIAAAVDARALSSLKSERVAAGAVFARPAATPLADSKKFVSLVHDALYAAKIMSYAQGMALIAAASKEYNWSLNLGAISAMWKGGCIIRARFLDDIRRAFDEEKGIANLLMSQHMKTEVAKSIGALREVVSAAALAGVPVPALGASLAYFDAYTTARLPQNLTQGQRDFFGAHTYERTDKPGSFHTQW